jgi:C4-dicarboxylate-specific signal transduction histidine kinase/ligand-binding sensor domain-containing protein/CheY-like chemotaxis protein
MSRLAKLCCSVAAAIATLAAAPATRADSERWAKLADTVFQHLAQDSDLPNSTVPTALAEDAEGFLWIASQNGLARWDGYRFRTFTPDPRTPGALPDGFIKTLHCDARGRLWIGTSSGGLVRYDRDRDRFVTYPAGPNGPSHVSVRVIAGDGAGGLWVATEGGLDHLDPDTGAISHLRHDGKDPGSLPDDHVRTLLRDRTGALWVGTPGGLARRDEGATRFQVVPLPSTDGNTPVARVLLEDGGGRIWVGTVRHGAYLIQPGDGTARPVQETAPAGSALQTEGVYSAAEVRPGEVWLGTLGQGIVAVDAATLRTRRIRHDPTLPASLPDDTVHALYRDRAGLTWVGTNRSISRHDPRQTAVTTVFGGSSRKDGLSDAEVDAVMPMPDGRIWLGLGSNGVDVIDPVGVRVGSLRPDPLRAEEALPRAYVNAIATAADGDVYLGTEQGLYRTDQAAQGVTRVRVSERDPTGPVWTLLLDEGALWVGGGDGLWGLQLGRSGLPTPIRPSAADPLTDRRVTAIARGRGGSLWVGTKNGLNRFDPASLAVERILPVPADAAALTAGYVSSLLTDRRGRLWVGTVGGGIHVLDAGDGAGDGGRPRFRHLSVAQGLQNSDIGMLLQDLQGRIWASTDDGIAVIDPETFAVRSLRRAEGVSILNYWVGSGAVTPAGEVLFGGVGGLTVVRPDQLKDWTYRPPIVVTEVLVGGKPVAASRFNGGGAIDPLVIAPAANSLAVEFSALDYSAPERNRYAYRLDGFDADWVDTAPAHRVAAYTTLPPGDHALHLRGSNRDGVWTEATLTLPIRVLPAWDQTLAFRVAEALAALALVGALVQIRTAYLRRRQRELERQVAERTDQLRQRAVELALNEERLRLALIAARQVEWDHDVATGTRSVGEGWRLITGRAPREADTPERWRMLLHPDDRARAWERLQDYLEGRSETETYESEYRLSTTDGWRWVRSRGKITERDGAGRPLRMIGTTTDVDEVHTLQEKLLAASRLASVGTLAAGVAHEINNPLAAVKANLACAVEAVSPGAESVRPEGRAELLKLLDDALLSTDQIAAIVKAMRSLGRPERAEAVQDVDVRTELLNAVQMVRNQLQQRARLEIAVPDGLPNVRARTSELGRVFLNLLINAAEAIPEGQAAAHRIGVEARRVGGEVVVEIADSGSGIAPAVREQIFDPFFTTKPVGQGSGLGLTISRTIVDLAGGAIEVQSEVGRGATFRVRLPAAPAGGVPAAEAMAPVRGERVRRRVLIIDDEPAVGRALERLLRSRHDVVALESADDALRRLDAGEAWDAILCDVMMSGMDGAGFHAALAERDSSLLRHVAFITGGAFGDRATSFLSEHDVIVVPKPVELPLLLDVIDRLARAAP